MNAAEERNVIPMPTPVPAAEHQTQAAPTPEALGTGNLEKVRDILFGAQMRDYDRRFARLEERLVKEAAVSTRWRISSNRRSPRWATGCAPKITSAPKPAKKSRANCVTQRVRWASAFTNWICKRRKANVICVNNYWRKPNSWPTKSGKNTKKSRLRWCANPAKSGTTRLTAQHWPISLPNWRCGSTTNSNCRATSNPAGGKQPTRHTPPIVCQPSL